MKIFDMKKCDEGISQCLMSVCAENVKWKCVMKMCNEIV